MIRVCSGFSPRGYAEYGKRFLETFHNYWPKEIDLVVYGEKPVDMPRGEFRSLWDCHGAPEFLARHRNDAEKNGRKPRHGWREREIKGGYCYKFDACKFFRQLFIPEGAAKGMDSGDILVWLDGDVITFADVPSDAIPKMMHGHDLAFLGRQGAHSEIGFWAVRITPEIKGFLSALAEIWRIDAVFDLPEWHSAYVFDHVRKCGKFSQIDLTPGGRAHVWFQSPLGKFSDHCKGEHRKRLGFSPERKRNERSS
jgi:hypothetical protein